MHNTLLVAISYALLVSCTAQAQTVMVNDNLHFLFRPDPVPGERNVSFTVYQHVAGAAAPECVAECYTQVGLTYAGESLSAGLTTIDTGSDWYLTQPGDVFSAATVEAGRFPVLQDMSSEGPIISNTVNVGTDDFYLGVRTNPNYPNPGFRTAYGWVHLRPVDGVLTMVENVMSYNSRGIVVGTTTVVPEPHTVGMFLTIAATLAVFRWSRRRQKINATEGG